MNNTFSLKRYIAFSKNIYLANIKQYRFIPVWILLSFIYFLNFNFTETIILSEEDVANRISFANNWSVIMIGLGILTISRLHSIWMSSKVSSLDYFTLPVSNIEKYIFLLLNTTVVPVLIIFLFVVLPTAELAELFYVQDSTTGIMYHKALFGSQDISGTPLNIINSPFTLTNILYLMLLGVISLWGAVSYENKKQMYATIIHILVYAAFFFGFNFILSKTNGTIPVCLVDVFNIALSFLIIVYLFVSWKKLKNKQKNGGKAVERIDLTLLIANILAYIAILATLLI